MKKRMLVCLLMMLLAVFSVAAAEETRIPVAENDRLALSLSVDLCGFEVLDKQTGVTWSSSMNDPTFTGKLAGLNQKKANSLLTVNVTNLAKGAGSITNAVLLERIAAGRKLRPLWRTASSSTTIWRRRALRWMWRCCWRTKACWCACRTRESTAMRISPSSPST